MELYLPPIIPEPAKPRIRDEKGRFLKGCNGCKGRKVKFSEEGMKKIMQNLQKAIAAKGRKGTNNGRKVIAISNDGKITCYPSANFAERANNLCHGVVSNRCSGKTSNREIGGLSWYWEDDDRWMEQVNEI